MSQNPVFVSYSRKEYFFTESLVLHLQRHGIDAWFDVQELEPGIGWKSDIQQGLDRCESLVLVASSASLASPYVKLEWQSVLEAHKAIHVVIFEPIVLPPELASPATIIDFTQGFERSIPLLVKAIQGPSNHHDPLPTARRLPAAVEQLSHLMRRRVVLWWVLLAATLAIVAKSTAVLLTTGFVFVDDLSLNLLIYGVTLLVTSGVLYVLWDNRTWLNLVPRFLNRKNAPVTLWFRASEFQTAGAILTVVLTLPCVAALQTTLFLVLLLPAFWILLGPLIRRSRTTEAALLFSNPDLLRWCHIGNDVPYDWRILLNQAVLPEGMTVEVLSKMVTGTEIEGRQTADFEVVTGIYVSVKDAIPSWKTYRLYATPQIQAVKQYIKTILEKNHFQEVQDDISVPDYHVVLLGPWTPVEATRTLIEKYPDSTLPVLVATSNLSPLPDISRLQLVDFRQRYEPALASALQYLHTQAFQQRSVFSLAVLPVQLSSSFPLFELRSLQQAILIMSSLNLFFGLLGLISLALPAINPVFLARSTFPFVLSVLVYVLTIGAAWWLARSASEIGNLVPQSLRRFRLVMVGGVLLMASACAFGLQPSITFNAPHDVFGDRLAWRGIDIVLLLLVSIVPFILMELAIRRGLIAAKWHDVLSVPQVTFRFGSLRIRQFGLIALGYFIVALMMEGTHNLSDMIDNTYVLCLSFFVMSFFALAGVAILQGVLRPSVIQVEVPFAFKDAPSLRYQMKKALRSRKHTAS